MAGINPAHDLLHKTALEDIVSEQTEVWTVKPSSNLWETVKLLREKKIQSVPVVDDNGEFQGLLDVADVTNYIIACSPNPSKITHAPITDLAIAGRAFSLVDVSRVMGMFSKDVQPIFHKDPVSHACNMFMSNVHHTVLQDENKKVTKVVTQFDVIKLLAARLPDSMKDMSLNDFGYGVCDVFSIDSHSPVLQALQKLAIRSVNALAVVDDQGLLKANFSASDLVGLYADDVPHLADPVLKFLEDHSPRSLTPICVTPDQSLREALQTFVDNKIHHAWVVSDGTPIGLVSSTDLITLAMNWRQ